VQHAQHAAAEAQRAVASAAESGEKTSGRCPGGSSKTVEKKVVLTADHLATQKYTCTCGRVFEGKSKFKPVQEGGAWMFVVPGHNLPAATAAAPAAPAAGAPPELPRQTEIPQTQIPPALPVNTPPALPPVLPVASVPPALPLAIPPALPSPTPPAAVNSPYTEREKQIFNDGVKHGKEAMLVAIGAATRQIIEQSSK
jgi:hypothetical protein